MGRGPVPALSEANQLDEFRSQVTAQTKELLATFPARMAELGLMLTAPIFSMGSEELRAPLDIPMPDPNQKKKKGKDEEEEAPPCPPIPSHGSILALLEKLRPLLAEGRIHLAQVELWLKLQVPRIEDGDNFGVAVQEKVLELLTSSHTQLETLQNRIPKYLLERGDAVAKAVKNPHVEDYRAAVHVLDVAELSAARLALTQLRDTYAVLLDAVRKNLDKLQKPRGEPKSIIF